jgi:hypothetical protein
MPRFGCLGDQLVTTLLIGRHVKVYDSASKSGIFGGPTAWTGCSGSIRWPSRRDGVIVSLASIEEDRSRAVRGAAADLTDTMVSLVMTDYRGAAVTHPSLPSWILLIDCAGEI